MENKEEFKGFDLYGATKEFAFRSVKLYQYLTESKEKKEYNLAKQFLLAATRIGDLLRQDNNIEAYHSARSAKYWLEVLQSGGYLTNEETESMINDCLPLIKIIYVRVHPEARKDKGNTNSNAYSSPSSASTPVSSSFAAGKIQKGGAR